MLEEALKVVEAVRQLQLKFEFGKTRSSLDVQGLSRGLDELRESLELFDKLTSHGRGNPGMVPRPDFATPPQMDDEAFVLQELQNRQTLDVDDVPPNLLPQILPEEPDAKIETKVQGVEKEQIFRDAEVRKDFTPTNIPIFATPVTRRDLRLGAHADYSDLSTDFMMDGDENIEDFILALDAIEDKLGFYLVKQGWSPKLTKLAAAINEMRGRLILEVSRDGASIKMPVAEYSNLLTQVANAVADKELNISIPRLEGRPNQAIDIDKLVEQVGNIPPDQIPQIRYGGRELTQKEIELLKAKLGYDDNAIKPKFM